MHPQLSARGAGRQSNQIPATTLVVAAMMVTDRSRSLSPLRSAFQDACIAAEVKTNPATTGLMTTLAWHETPSASFWLN